MHRISRASGLALGVLLSCTLLSQPSRAADEGCSSDLGKIISELGVRLKKTFQIDPRVRGCLHERVDVAQTSFRDLQALLALYGFMDTAETGGIIQIIPDANARQTPLRLIDDQARDVGEFEVVMKIIDTAPLNAAVLVPILRPILPQYAHLVAVSQTNSMIVVGRYGNVRTVETLLRALRTRPLVPMEPFKDDASRGAVAPAK
jgi:general secretion pathway protein D